MRIAFIASGLEAGRDGVGDYSRLLGGELERQGHAAALVALNDPFAPAHGSGSLADSENFSRGMLRLGADLPWDDRIARAKAFLAEFNPDWVSLQFVGYGFHPRGIVSSLAPGFRALLSGHAVHFNFHELWIGCQAGAKLKARCLGWLQRRSIAQLIRRTGPKLVTTTNSIYLSLLQSSGIAASALPIFGNIPIDQSAHGWCDEQMRMAGIPRSEETRGRQWVFVFFGTLHPEWRAEALFSRLKAAAEAQGRAVIFLLLGRPSGGNGSWLAWEKTHGSDFRFVELGEQSSERVSDVLSTADAGISTMTLELIEKSGSAAAMFDHGLPVIVTRREPFRGERSEPAMNNLILQLDGRLETELARGPARRAPEWKLSPIAAEFISKLERAGEKERHGAQRL